MKEILLSNGVHIEAFVGDGFDGGSGVYVHYKDRSGPERPGLFGYPIPQQDIPAVLKLLRWYAEQETKLRHWEGKHWRNMSWDSPRLPSESNPYQITFYIGHLESHLSKKKEK